MGSAHALSDSHRWAHAVLVALILAFLPPKLLIKVLQALENAMHLGSHASSRTRWLLEKLEGCVFRVVGACVGLLLGFLHVFGVLLVI